MVLISFTNIVVDDFAYAKRNPLKRYIYFLTHMHSDHYQGLTNGWDYGQIFCSSITKALLLVKFPKLQNVLTIPMKTPTDIQLHSEKPEYRVTVTFLDANHCPGAVMILFQGYFGTILHTGDMRFHMEMLYNNPQLYPSENIANLQKQRQIQELDSDVYKEQAIQTLDACSIHIDELILDNTYCDPIFKFPNRDEAFQMICEIIDSNNAQRVFLCVDSVGKEELMVILGQHYKTMIVVNEQRFEMILAMSYHIEMFTTNKAEGWIEVIRKGEIDERLKEPHTIGITATGWANTSSYQMRNRKYVIPYSLHSNFNEMHQFVRSIRPCILQKVVKNKSGKSDKIYNITEFSQYMITLTYLKQRVFAIYKKGFEFFLKNYVDASKLSEQYKRLMLDREQQEKINRDLGITLIEEDAFYVNQMEFKEKHKNVFQNKNKVRKGFAFKPPEKNDNFKITQFIRAKKQLENNEKCKKLQNLIEIKDESSNEDKKSEKRKDDPTRDSSVITFRINKSSKQQENPLVINDE